MCQLIEAHSFTKTLSNDLQCPDSKLENEHLQEHFCALQTIFKLLENILEVASNQVFHNFEDHIHRLGLEIFRLGFFQKTVQDPLLGVEDEIEGSEHHEFVLSTLISFIIEFSQLHLTFVELISISYF